jgi:hypothetical protein
LFWNISIQLVHLSLRIRSTHPALLSAPAGSRNLDLFCFSYLFVEHESAVGRLQEGQEGLSGVFAAVSSPQCGQHKELLMLERGFDLPPRLILLGF